MADRPDRKRVKLRKPDTATYEVGYRKPPQKSRFKPGQSGNPRGRPKGSKRTPHLNEERMKEIVLEEAYRTISIRDGARAVTLPIIQAVIRSLAVTAARGNQRSQRLFTDLLKCVERDNKALHDEWLQTAMEYKVEWERELERRQRLGIKAPDPIPHPDDIVVNLQAGTVEIRGPATKGEKGVRDQLRQMKKECDEEIARLEVLLSADPDNERLKEDIARQYRIRAAMTECFPD